MLRHLLHVNMCLDYILNTAVCCVGQHCCNHDHEMLWATFLTDLYDLCPFLCPQGCDRACSSIGAAYDHTAAMLCNLCFRAIHIFGGFADDGLGKGTKLNATSYDSNALINSVSNGNVPAAVLLIATPDSMMRVQASLSARSICCNDTLQYLPQDLCEDVQTK